MTRTIKLRTNEKEIENKKYTQIKMKKANNLRFFCIIKTFEGVKKISQ